MARYQVVIETHETEGGFTADVAEGPIWLIGAGAFAEQREDAATALRRQIRRAYGKHSFDFLHAKA